LLRANAASPVGLDGGGGDHMAASVHAPCRSRTSGRSHASCRCARPITAIPCNPGHADVFRGDTARVARSKPGKDEDWPLQVTQNVTRRTLSLIDRWQLPDAKYDGIEKLPGYFDRLAG